MSVIRVVSYNIHKGRSATGSRESLSDLRLGLYGLRPDLLFLQEVQGRNELHSQLHAQHESLGAALCMNTAYGCNAVRAQTDHGNALLSRFPILEHENQDISDHKLEQRGLLHALVGLLGAVAEPDEPYWRVSVMSLVVVLTAVTRTRSSVPTIVCPPHARACRFVVICPFLVIRV